MTDAPCSPDQPAFNPRDALAALVRAWRRERALRATAGALASLSDQTLRDIGVHRGDIAAEVMRRCDER